jgi:ribosomal protein S4
LDIRTVLDRRLQSIVYKKGLVNSSKQARQFILHRKVTVDNKVITAPSYIVTKKNDVKLIEGFAPKIEKIIKAPVVAPMKVSEAPENKTNAQVAEELAKTATKEANK